MLVNYFYSLDNYKEKWVRKNNLFIESRKNN